MNAKMLEGTLVRDYMICMVGFVGIKPLKVRHDVTKLDLTIPLLPFWYTDIDLSMQSIFLTLYMTWVY